MTETRNKSFDSTSTTKNNFPSFPSSFPSSSSSSSSISSDDIKLRSEVIVGLCSLYTKHLKDETTNKIKTILNSNNLPSFNSPPPPSSSSSNNNNNNQYRLRAYSTGMIPSNYNPNSTTTSTTTTTTTSATNNQRTYSNSSSNSNS